MEQAEELYGVAVRFFTHQHSLELTGEPSVKTIATLVKSVSTPAHSGFAVQSQCTSPSFLLCSCSTGLSMLQLLMTFTRDSPPMLQA